MEFSEEGYVGLDTSRLEIFKSAIFLIKSNPIFGIGAASFPEIFNLWVNVGFIWVKMWLSWA